MSKATRHSWTLRKELVHAAGCTHERCIARCGAQGAIEYVYRSGARIPRSLRKYAPQGELDAEWVRQRDNRRAVMALAKSILRDLICCANETERNG